MKSKKQYKNTSNDPEMSIKTAYVALFIVFAAFMAAVFLQNLALAQAESQISLSWKGWRAAVLRYEKTRAPDEHYSLGTHQEAAELFREGVRERYTTQTVHWSAVRLICETMKMTVLYTQQEKNRRDYTNQTREVQP